MNCKEQAKKIYLLCVARANTSKENITYRETLDELGYGKHVRGYAIRYGLELVLIACVDKGLPILTSIIVNQSTGKPTPPTPTGEDPDNLYQSWESETQKVFGYDEWPDVDMIDWEYIWENRHYLSNKHRIGGYWSHK